MGFFGLFRKKSTLQECGVISGSIDRHSHILYGVDDGIGSLEEALAVLAYEESIGVREVWCTPHIMEDVPNTTADLKHKFEKLCDLYKGHIKLCLAAEYMLDNLFEDRLDAHDLLTMEDDILLVETSTVAPPYDLEGILSSIRSEGYNPMFAHPERCVFLSEKQYSRMYEAGVRFQLNIASLTGFYGETVQKKAKWLLDNSMYSAFGSDCHRLKTLQRQYNRAEITSDMIKALEKIKN